MYQIWKNKEFRPKTEYVILCQAKNTRETRFAHFNPLLIKSTMQYTWGYWQEYYMEDLKRRKLPCHYYVEYLDRDYVVFQGLSEEYPSYFIRELVEAGIVKSEYKNAILVTIGENYNIDIPEFRMYEQMCSKCLCSLMRRYKLNQERIVYFDEILSPNWEVMLKQSELTYDIETTSNFDRVILRQFLDYYKHN